MPKPLDESALIKTLFMPLTRGVPEALGLVDDVALLSLRGTWVVSVDSLCAGVHFLSSDPPQGVGSKLAAVTLSDVMVKGAAPRFCVLSAAFSRGTSRSWMKNFARGLGKALQAYKLPLVGGDTISTPGPSVFSLTVLGEAKKMCFRGGAQEGDHIYVTGTLGDAALGLRVAQKKSSFSFLSVRERARLIDCYRLPRPPLGLGQHLHKFAHAATDISDGLLGDLGHLCKASGVGARVECKNLPVSLVAQKIFRHHPRLRPLVWRGGDDYQFLFTVPPGRTKRLHKIVRPLPIKASFIGVVTASEVRLLDSRGRAVRGGGYSHF